MAVCLMNSILFVVFMNKSVIVIAVASVLIVSCGTEPTPWSASDVCPDAPGILHDDRDGQDYKIVKIGTQTWMAENLNYATDNSWCYDDADSNCAKYGRLYGFTTATSICPSGWHLPSSEEWNNLAEVMGGMDDAGLRLKANIINGTDDCQFSALPGGEKGFFTGYRQKGYWGYWWSSSHYAGPWVGVRVVIESADKIAEISGHDDREYVSVRCIKD